MKLPFVSRKKYDIAKANYQTSVSHRQTLQRKNEKLQEVKQILENKLMESEEKIKELQRILNDAQIANNCTIAYTRQCVKCNKIFTVCNKKSRSKICPECKKKTAKKEEE